MQGAAQKPAGRRLDARRFVRRVARRGHCHCLRRDAAGSAVRGDNGYGDRVRVLIAARYSRLSYKLDRSLSTNTIILIGVIFSMFVSSIMSIVITFAADKVQRITFWTMGSLSGSTYQNAAVLAGALLICGTVILLHAQILNAFAVGEDNARQIGVDVKRAKLVLLIMVSMLIGVCVSIGGTIGFVGLVTPHMARMLVGPNHKRLLPAAMFGGAVFLMLADLIARILLNPLELPIGVVTSFVGAIVFVVIFYQSRKEH